MKTLSAQDYVFSSHSSLLKANASSQEQKFIENLVVESIEIYGQDIYYVPRTLVNRDTVFGEDSDSTFDSARAIRAYVNNVEGWEGQGELLSKFGIRVEDKTTFIFSREKFTEKVDDLETLIVEGRPNEGDLIWFPITKHLFEIKFVEVEKPFYQLGRVCLGMSMRTVRVQRRRTRYRHYRDRCYRNYLCQCYQVGYGCWW